MVAMNRYRDEVAEPCRRFGVRKLDLVTAESGTIPERRAASRAAPG